ncbi:hypothetical protein PIB30_091539, partial [Stylosanthes scabra]|nr:hypothetical protein [Stylosanthes scabra]
MAEATARPSSILCCRRSSSWVAAASSELFEPHLRYLTRKKLRTWFDRRPRVMGREA